MKAITLKWCNADPAALLRGHVSNGLGHQNHGTVTQAAP